MSIKQRTIYDINSDRFTYLKRKNKFSHRADINELNKRLNETRKSNFYATTLIVSICLFGLVVLSFIGLKF